VSDQVVEFFGMRLGRCMCAGDATSPQGGRRMSTMKKKPTRIDSGIWLICTSMILLMRGELGRGLARAVKASLRIAILMRSHRCRAPSATARHVPACAL
jgi:hypothetical protein